MTEQHYRMTLADAIAQYGHEFGVIYRLYCEITNFSYVGQTQDVHSVYSKSSKDLTRIKTHYNALRKGCHPCLKLQAAWNSTQGKSIKYEILEIIPCNGESKGSGTFRLRLASAEKRWQQNYKHHTEPSPDRHYALKAEELKQLKNAGIINNATFIYFALKLKNPWCDRPLRIKPAELAVELDLPESSIYEAIAKLKASELISIDKAEIIVRWQNHSQQDSHSDNPELITETQNGLSEPRMDSDNPELITETQNGFQKPRMDSDNSENHQPEPLQDKDSKNPHTIHTYSDFINTLSDREREEFLKFGEQKAAQLPHPPALPRRWVEINWEELADQWYKSKGKTPPAQNCKWENDPRTPNWLAIIEETANPLEFAVGDKEKLDFVRWARETKQFSWLREES